MTARVDNGEEGEEDPACLVVGHVLVQRNDAVQAETSEEGDQLATHEKDQGEEADVDPLARGPGRDNQVVPASPLSVGTVWRTETFRRQLMKITIAEAIVYIYEM